MDLNVASLGVGTMGGFRFETRTRVLAPEHLGVCGLPQIMVRLLVEAAFGGGVESAHAERCVDSMMRSGRRWRVFFFALVFWNVAKLQAAFHIETVQYDFSYSHCPR